MSKLNSLSKIALAGCLGLFACGTPKQDESSPRTDGMSDVDGTTDMGAAIDMKVADPYSWGEAAAGMTVGPFGDFKLFRSGCGEHLWARWIPRQDFDLLATKILGPNGRLHQTGYVTIPKFKDKEKIVFPLSTDSAGGFPLGSYTLDLTVRNPSGTSLTHTINMAVEDQMYRWPGQLSLVSERVSGSSTFFTLQSTINGELESCTVYDDRGCYVSGTGFITPVPIVKGEKGENRCGKVLTAGQRYLIVLLGQDSDRSYPFYATTDRN